MPFYRITIMNENPEVKTKHKYIWHHSRPEYFEYKGKRYLIPTDSIYTLSRLIKRELVLLESYCFYNIKNAYSGNIIRQSKEDI